MAWWESSGRYLLAVTPPGGRTWYTSVRELTRTDARAWQQAAYSRQGGSRVALWKIRTGSSMLEGSPVWEYLGAIG